MAKDKLCSGCAFDEELCMCRGCDKANGCKISVESDGTCKYFMDVNEIKSL